MESDISAIRARIDVIEHRLTALADRGADIAGLSSQLVHARDLLETGDSEAAQEVTDGVASGVRQIATGEARSSGEIRFAAREQLVGEVREALVGGAADNVITARIEQLRVEMLQRMETFERRLRDQFARELAQLISSRPWMKDVLTLHNDARATLTDESNVRRIVQSILDQQPPSPVGEGSADIRNGVTQLRDQVSGLRKRVEADAGSTDGVEAFAARFERTISEITASEEGVAGLVANVADAQAQLADRLLALERKLAAQTPAAASIAETGITALHVSAGDESRTNSATVATESGALVAVEKRVPLADTVIPTADQASPVPTSAPGVVPGSGTRPVESHAWPFGEESSADKQGVSQLEIDALLSAATASSDPGTGMANTAMPQPIVSGGSGGRARALIGPGDDASTNSEQARPQQMTDRSVSIQRAVTDEATVRRLIEERLAGWKPPPGDGLVQDDDEQIAQITRLFPQVLDDGSVRTALFATLALEAIERPGALAHLTQLRTFLRNELVLAVEQMQGDSIPRG